MGLYLCLSSTFSIFRTGQSNLLDVGKVYSWNDQTELDFWKNDSSCNAIKGTDGSTFHPEIQRNETLHIFNRDLCRSLPLVYQKDVVESNGIPGYRLLIQSYIFDVSSIYKFPFKCYISTK